MKKYLLLGILWVFASAVIAQPNSAQSKTTMQPQLVHTQSSVPTDKERIDKLETSLVIIRDYNSSFMSVILWSLGTICTFVVAFFGINTYTNVKMHQREIQNLRDELLAVIGEKNAESQQKLAESLSSQTKNLLNDSIKAAKDSNTSKFQKINYDIEEIKQDIVGIEYDKLKSEIDKWLNEKVYANACTTAAKKLALSKKMGHSYFIEESINDLQKCVTKFKDVPNALDARILNTVDESLKSLGDEFKSSQSRISAELEQIFRLAQK